MKKKYWIIAIIVLLLGGGIFYTYDSFRGGQDLYVKITTDGKRIESKADNGDVIIDYTYNLTAYDAKGQAKKVTFNGNKTVPLRRNAYLKLTYNKGKGVVSWEEVKASQVPAPALKELK